MYRLMEFGNVIVELSTLEILNNRLEAKGSIKEYLQKESITMEDFLTIAVIHHKTHKPVNEINITSNPLMMKKNDKVSGIIDSIRATMGVVDISGNVKKGLFIPEYFGSFHYNLFTVKRDISRGFRYYPVMKTDYSVCRELIIENMKEVLGSESGKVVISSPYIEEVFQRIKILVSKMTKNLLLPRDYSDRIVSRVKELLANSFEAKEGNLRAYIVRIDEYIDNYSKITDDCKYLILIILLNLLFEGSLIGIELKGLRTLECRELREEMFRYLSTI